MMQPLFMVRYCLRGRRKRSSNTPKIIPKTLYNLKTRNLIIKNYKMMIRNLTKGLNSPTRSHYLNLRMKLNQIPSLKNPTSRLLRNTAAVNVPDMKEDTTRP